MKQKLPPTKVRLRTRRRKPAGLAQNRQPFIHHPHAFPPATPAPSHLPYPPPRRSSKRDTGLETVSLTSEEGLRRLGNPRGQGLVREAGLLRGGVTDHAQGTDSDPPVRWNAQALAMCGHHRRPP